jgi:hypothetical protein
MIRTVRINRPSDPPAANPAAPPAVNPPTGVAAYRAILASYHEAYAPPSWVDTHAQSLVDKYGHASVCYYHRGADLEVVRKLATQREPVNIGGSQGFDKPTLMAAFGWQRGYYDTHYAHTNELAPNIAVYCLSPVVPSTVTQRGDGEPLPHPVHMLHSIGYAFDMPHQTDCAHLLSEIAGVDAALTQTLTALYTSLFGLVFACARDKGCSFVCLGLVGAGYFASMYPDGPRRFRSDVWLPALEQAIAHAQWSRPRVHVLGTAKTGDFPMAGFFPECIPKYPTDTLFVNAWDPLSMVGNGNEYDSSLDGHFGRCSAAALLCWPVSNVRLTYRAVG